MNPKTTVDEIINRTESKTSSVDIPKPRGMDGGGGWLILFSREYLTISKDFSCHNLGGEGGGCYLVGRG